jgi:hypothetical protein
LLEGHNVLKRFGLIAIVLLIAWPAAAQNALTGTTALAAQLIPPLPELACTGGPDAGLGPLHWRFEPGSKFAFCAPGNSTDAAQASSFTYRAYIDNAPFALSAVTCAGATMPGVICRGDVPAPMLSAMRVAGDHNLEITASLDSAAPESPRSASFQVSDAAVCTYIPPGGTVAQQRPLYKDDPVMGSMQGFNPIAGQAQRIAQLRAWGWKVEWQFVDGSPRADKLDRLFLAAFCVGVPQ